MSTQPANDDLEELVPETRAPFGDFYVTRAKRMRSAELRAALAALSGDKE